MEGIEGFRSAADYSKDIVKQTAIGKDVWKEIKTRIPKPEIEEGTAAKLSRGNELGIKFRIYGKAIGGGLAAIVALPFTLILGPIGFVGMCYQAIQANRAENKEKTRKGVDYLSFSQKDEIRKPYEKGMATAGLVATAPVTIVAVTLRSICNDIRKLEASEEAKK